MHSFELLLALELFRFYFSTPLLLKIWAVPNFFYFFTNTNNDTFNIFICPEQVSLVCTVFKYVPILLDSAKMLLLLTLENNL